MFLTAVVLFLYNQTSPKTAPAIALAQAPQSKVAKTQEKNIYLTFDDGPSDSTTPYILDVLNEEDVEATFFIIGRQAELRPALIERIAENGHTLGIHSYSHDYAKIYRSPVTLLEDIKKCSAVLESILGLETDLYRFPGGSYSLRKELVDSVVGAGYRYIDWNASCRDAEIVNASPDALFQAAITTPTDKNNIVLLLHDSARRKNTVAALKKIIPYYKKAGYTFQTF